MNYDKNEIITALGIESMNPEMQDKVVESVHSTMNMRLAMRVADELNDEQLEAFNKQVETDANGVADWLTATVPGFEATVDEEAQSVLAEIKQSVNNMNL